MRFSGLILAAVAITSVQAAQPTAQQIVERIQKNIGVPWKLPTVDTFKAGDPQTPVTGVAVTMMATLEVLEKAAASGSNFVITHEPTFYNHLDKTVELANRHDAVLAEKEAFIRDHHMVVWRFHDHWHQRHPDGILEGMTNALGWQKFRSPDAPYLFTMPETTLNDLAVSTQKKLSITVERIVGDPNLKLTHVALIPGAAGSQRQIEALERDDVEALVIGETQEWETVEYVADAATEHRHKALIILSHIPSEQAGMQECVDWLKSFVPEVPIAFVAAAQPFWTPKP